MHHQIEVFGRLTRDPEMRYTPSGLAVTNLNIAANRVWKNPAGEYVKETIYFKAATWGAQAENASQYLTKGQEVFVIGTLLAAENGTPAVYQKNDGTWASQFEIRISKLVYGAKPSYTGDENENSNTSEVSESQSQETLEIPF